MSSKAHINTASVVGFASASAASRKREYESVMVWRCEYIALINHIYIFVIDAPHIIYFFWLELRITLIYMTIRLSVMDRFFSFQHSVDCCIWFVHFAYGFNLISTRSRMVVPY